MKKIGNILFLYFFVFVMCMGASFAWYTWKGSEVSVSINFADLDPYIKYSSTKVEGTTITPSSNYKGGVSNDITFNKEESGDNLNVYGHIYLKVTSADNDNLFKASNLKWTLVSVNNNTETKIATGNFVGESVVSDNDTSKMIPANINFPLTKYNENTTYKVYVWVDSDAPMNKDISNNNIKVDTYVEANTYDDNTGKLNELHIREVDYQVGKITKIVGYSSIYNITHYMITSSTTNPTSSDTNWISISSPSTLVTITPNYSMDDNNNICIKDSENNIYCKSINVEKVTYTATFTKSTGVSSIGTSSLSCTTTETSCSVTAPSITSSTGYGTGKWGTSSSTQGSISAGSSITLSSNATYYAIAKPNTYLIKFNANGGSGSMANIQMTYDKSSTLTSNNYTKKYTVTYDYNNATSGNNVSSATASYNFVGWTMGGPNLYSKLNLNSNNFSIDDNGMLYINKTNSSSDAQYVNFFYNTRDDIVSGNDYTEIAVIKSLTYSGDMNYYVGDTPNNTGTITQVSDGVKSVSDLIVGNNYFSLTGTSITNPSLLSRGFIGIPASASLNIKFRPVLIAAKYNNIDMYYYNCGTIKNLTSVANGTVNLYADWNETSVTLPTPTKNRYTFKGWYTSASGGTKVGDGGDSYIPTSNITLYARWEDTTPPTLTLSHNNGVITITSDTSNLYSGTSPSGTTNETTITNVSSSEPGPVTDSITWKLETSGSDNPQWIGWQGTYGNVFNGSANDLIIISGYYKSSQLNDLSDLVASTLYQSDWSSYSTTTIEYEDDLVEDGQWHYFHETFRVNEAFSNAIIGWAPAFGYSTKKRTIYINGLNWRVVPSSNTTASDIHIRKWASGSQSLSYFQNGGGTQISGNSFNVSSAGTYTVYVEDTAGNGTIKTIDVYSISYDLDGGSASNNPSYYDKTTSSITINSPTKSGIQFLGWYGSNDVSSGLDSYTSSNTYTASSRDHILGNDFSVSEGETYRVFVTAKRTSGSLDMQGGIWYTELSSGNSYDNYGGIFSIFETLSNGYAKYYKDITIPSGKTKGKFYIQIEQDKSDGDTTWLLYDMHAIKLGSNPTIPKGSTGNKSYTANWLNIRTLTIWKETGVGTIYYKVNGASSYSSTTSNLSTSVKYGTTYYYYGVASTGYTMSSCTSSSPCSGTVGSSDISISLSATVNSYYLDLNGYLDSSASGGISGYGTADVYINGTLVCDDCTDYYAAHPYGSSYEIKDIKATTGHTYNGVYSGSLSGTIPSYNYGVYLNFTSNTYYIYYNANDGSGAPSTQSYTYSTSGTVTLSSTTPTKSGYNFLGWSTSSSAGSPSYYAGGSFPKSTASNTTLYAVYGLPTGINAYRGVTTSYYESGTKDFLYITTCGSSNTDYCNYTAKNADSSTGTILRGKLTNEIATSSAIAKTIGSTICNSSGCAVYIFTQPGLTTDSASVNQIVGVLLAHNISSSNPVYKTSSVSGNSRKVFFSYTTGNNIITDFTLSYYAYGAGTIHKVSYQGDWYFGWVSKSYIV